jgi:hypothetical protein
MTNAHKILAGNPKWENKCREDKVCDYVSSSNLRTEPEYKDS